MSDTDQPTPPAVPDDRFDEATLACLVKWSIESIEEQASNATWCEPVAAGFRNRALALRIIHQRLAHAEAALAAERERAQKAEADRLKANAEGGQLLNEIAGWTEQCDRQAAQVEELRWWLQDVANRLDEYDGGLGRGHAADIRAFLEKKP